MRLLEIDSAFVQTPLMRKSQVKAFYATLYSYQTSEKQSYYNLANFRPQLGAFLIHYHINAKSYGQ
jgi:hypothetical protein